MSELRAGFAGFDITPRFHPTCGAWGSTPTMTQLDMPLLARCVAFEQGDRTLVWFGSDLVGEVVPDTDAMRDEVADALNLIRDQVIWSTSQTHSSGAIPGSVLTGSVACDLSKQDPEFMDEERKRLMNGYKTAGREALGSLQPATLLAGRGHCDSVSYNTRLPMPNGGVKFSRHHEEGLQSGKPVDPTIGLLRFEDKAGRTIGAIFNFCAHPATMINNTMISPDWVGTARQHIEEALGGAPAMFCQGACGDVNCYHIFGSPDDARRTGARLGTAAAEAMPTLIPTRCQPFDFAYKTIDLPCQPMPTRQEFEHQIAERQEYIDRVMGEDPTSMWFSGVNMPEQMPPEDRKAVAELHLGYMREGLRRLDAGEPGPTSMPITLGAVRWGDAAAFLSPGENFCETGMKIRARSPFVHTLVCGDTNGLFGYMGTDAEIQCHGYETDTFWKMLYFGGFRLPPAKGLAGRIVNTSSELLEALWRMNR